MPDVGVYDCQRAVLGSLLIDPNALCGEVFHRVRDEDFQDRDLRTLFSASRTIWLEQGTLDPVTLSARAGKKYEPLMADVMRMTPTAANCMEYVKLLLEQARLHDLQVLGMQLMDCRDLEEARGMLAEAEGLMTARKTRKVASYGQMLHDFLERQADRSPPRHLRWGFRPLDKVLTVSPGRFVILGADSSVGKTAFALQLARSMAGEGQRVGFFSYETSCDDAMDRILANRAEVELARAKHKALSEEDYRRVTAEADQHHRLPLEIVEAAGCTVEELRSLTLAGRYEIIFIDYVQLIPAKGNERWQVVTEVSMALHTMAQQLGVTVIALSQVTPPEADKNGKRRMLAKGDLRESRQLINDADVILMMDLENPVLRDSRRVLMIDKNKDGVCGKFFLEFEPLHMRFSVASKAPGRKSAMQELAPGEGGDLPF